MSSEDDFGPVAREVAALINQQRLVTDVELQKTVTGDVQKAGLTQAIEYLLALVTGTTGACMRLAAEVDELNARLRAVEGTP